MHPMRLFSATLVLVLSAGAAEAASSPPVGPPRPGGGPVIALIPTPAAPYDYHFTDRVFGAGFRAHEGVRLTVEHVSASPVSVVAGAEGTFSTTVSFSWVFCGPDASAAQPPTVVAAGSDGSRTQLSLAAMPCPGLFLVLPSVTSNTNSGSVASGGTISGTPIVPPGPEPGPLPNPRLPQPPAAQSAVVTGFGFVPGEAVDVVERGAPRAVSGVTATADGFGRFRAALHVTLPAPCGAYIGRQWIEATGNRGTSAVAYLGFPRPLAVPCPVTGRPGGGTAPGSPAAVSNSTGTAILGLHLGQREVARGGAQSARVSLTSGAPITLSVRYAGGRQQTFHRRGKSGMLTVRWHVPRQAGSGGAGVTLSVPSLGVTLGQHFAVR